MLPRDSEVDYTRALAERACNLVKSFLENYKNSVTDGAILSIEEPRVKDKKSLIKKLEFREKELDEVSDIAGARIVCNYISDVRKVVSWLKSQVQCPVIKGQEWIETSNNGYRGVHLDLGVSWEDGEGRHQFTVEVQIRTSLQHAWATKSHKLLYKNPKEVPKPLAERLMRMSDMLFLLDQELEQLSLDIEEVQNEDAKLLYRNLISGTEDDNIESVSEFLVGSDNQLKENVIKNMLRHKTSRSIINNIMKKPESIDSEVAKSIREEILERAFRTFVEEEVISKLESEAAVGAPDDDFQPDFYVYHRDIAEVTLCWGDFELRAYSNWLGIAQVSETDVECGSVELESDTGINQTIVICLSSHSTDMGLKDLLDADPKELFKIKFVIDRDWGFWDRMGDPNRPDELEASIIPWENFSFKNVLRTFDEDASEENHFNHLIDSD